MRAQFDRRLRSRSVSAPGRPRAPILPVSVQPSARSRSQAPRPRPQVRPSPAERLRRKVNNPAPPPPRKLPTPYDHDLQRLSEILGALHFLRGICGSNEGQKWRNEAQALIDAEAPERRPPRSDGASFNRGYRGFQQSYRTCTPAAKIVIRRYLEEGAKIARDITARYAN